MKKIIFVLVIISLFSCKKEVLPYSDEFEKSEQLWNTYKNSIDNSYSYITYSGSVFGGHSETQITVQNGKVTGRFFISGVYQQNASQLVIKETWTEDLATLNTHINGAKSLTLDEIYRKASKEWLNVDTKTNDIYFSTDTMGFIASCGYVAKGCQDDCFTGVYIKAITKL
ncbi:MAG: hypothetical protein HYU71_00810 [Bacteroidetes bacterium]|nr:hypothetical protein [Bacteroidota bacterium]